MTVGVVPLLLELKMMVFGEYFGKKVQDVAALVFLQKTHNAHQFSITHFEKIWYYDLPPPK